jgi:ABC-type branched-subunit amino acid transport system substrate-binding protein
MRVKRGSLYAVLAVGVIACAGAGAGGASNRGAGAAKTYNVLFIGGITGPIASSANSILNGLKMSAGYINAHGGINGRKVKLTVLNSQSDPTQAVTLLQQQLSSGKTPDIVYSGVISNEALALTPILTRSKIISISNANNPKLNDVGSYPYHFGANPDSQTQIGAVKSQVPAGTQLVGILAPNNASGQGVVGRVQAAFASTGIKTAVRFYDQDAVDLTVPTQALVSQKPQAMVVDGTDVQAERVLAARLTVGYTNIPTFGTSGFGDKPPSAFAGKSALVNFFTSNDPGLVWKPKKQRCAPEQYLLKQGGFTGTSDRVVFVTALSYDELRTIATVANKIHKTDADSIKAGLERFKASPKDCFVTQPNRQYSSSSHFPLEPYRWYDARQETFADGLIKIG